MANSNAPFNRGVVRPVECLTSGFALIKGQYWLILGITVVGILIGALVPMGIIMGPMMCGIYLVLFERMAGRNVRFELLFKGFDYFLQSLIATLLLFAAMIVLLLPLYAFMIIAFFFFQHRHATGANPPPPGVSAAFIVGAGLFVLLFMAASMAIGVLLTFIYPLIVDRKLSGLEAVKLSIKAAWANFWSLLGLALLNALLGMAGVLACYFGAFFVLPISLAAQAMAYRQVFGLSPNQSLAPPPAQVR